MLPTILLFRHGETHWNRLKRIQGHTDAPSPLTLAGIDQSRAYGRAVRSVTGGEGGWRVMASPLARCVQTAAILCETADLPFADIIFDDRLREVDTGAFSGLTKAELEQRHPELLAQSGLKAWYFSCPGGESWEDMAGRMGAWLAEQRAGDRLVVVTHGVAGKVLRALYGGIRPEQALAEDAPQDALFLLRGGTVSRFACNDAVKMLECTAAN